MNYTIKSNGEAPKPKWYIAKKEDRRVISITVEIAVDFLEQPNRREFDRVGTAVAAELHNQYLLRP